MKTLFEGQMDYLAKLDPAASQTQIDIDNRFQEDEEKDDQQ